MLISKRYVITTSVCLVGTAFLGLSALVVGLRQDLARTQGSLDELSALARDQRDEIRRLHGELGEVGRELLDVQALGAEARRKLLEELEARREGESAAMRVELDRLEGRLSHLREAAAEHSRVLAAARTNEDLELRYRELMSPTVRVNALHEVGSGSILWSHSTGNKARTYVLSAWHIVQDNLGEDGPTALEIDFYEGGELLRTELGQIVAREEQLDLALIEVRGYHVYASMARLPTRADLERVEIFSKVYAIGCPLGYSPIPTSGELTSKEKELDGNHYWMINAPTIFGNSGGGIYVAKSRTLVGVLSRISAYKNMIDVAVPHMGLVTSLDKVYTWLDGTRYAFVYRNRLKELAPSSLPASMEEARGGEGE